MVSAADLAGTRRTDKVHRLSLFARRWLLLIGRGADIAGSILWSLLRVQRGIAGYFERGENPCR
ncbi:hypothetical protein ASE73_07855 [Sphingomonas sp. Leaf24]|nr:hypothetical protein ASE50_16965 [Sphingomonas sp. Leaf5]KQM76051.1 hypothetical protein ASE70_09535 [Sphingomonas sp. Leaf22]KQM89490.1 hypothetical protein ASE73_07855 [Sphingomonas sp. Leaf24]